MNKRIMVLLAEGFEEIEALATVDILRRGGVECQIVGLNNGEVTGSHGIRVCADAQLDEISPQDYDAIVLPGGLPGADHLRDDARVIKIVQEYAGNSAKYIAAICAAPQVLAKAEVVRGRRVTSYPSDEYREVLIMAGAEYVDDEKVVVDGNIITSRGPGTTFEFAYKILDVVGASSGVLREAMLYR